MPSNKKRTYTTPMGSKVKLTPNQKKYADTKLAHPNKALVEVAHEAYPAAQPNTLRQIVNMNEKNNDIAIYTGEQINKAAQTVVEIMNDERAKHETRLRAADSILDRELGKAVQRQINTNTNLNLNVEASQTLSDEFTEYIKGKTRAD